MIINTGSYIDIFYFVFTITSGFIVVQQLTLFKIYNSSHIVHLAIRYYFIYYNYLLFQQDYLLEPSDKL